MRQPDRDQWVKQITWAVTVDQVPLGIHAALVADMWDEAYEQGRRDMAAETATRHAQGAEALLETLHRIATREGTTP